MERLDTDLLVLIVTLFWLNSLSNNLDVLEIIEIFIAAITFLLIAAKLINRSDNK